MTPRRRRCDRCRKLGDHFCLPRADRAQRFIEKACKHTKGRYARKPFLLAGWQRDDIIRPLFGDVRWDAELRRYVRRYRIAWIELGRKNGKSEILAAIALYMLCADDEEGAEIYGAAKDRDQARKVFDVAMRMVQLSPMLSKRLTIKAHEKRIIDPQTASYYEVIAADAAGNLGHNPHCVIFDEVLTQPSADLWNALRTAMGTREQPMIVAATTAGSDPESFAANEHAYCERVAEDPARDPNRFVYMRNMPREADWRQIKNYQLPNPAMGDFLSQRALEDEIAEAVNDPTKENSVRQFRGNQWVSQVTRWIPLHLWDQAAGLVVESELAGRTCFAGLDMASTTDLAAWVLRFPAEDDKPPAVLWRFWTPEAQLPALDRYTAGKASVWAREGLLSATEGDWIDYTGAIHPQIAADHGRFRIVKAGYDPFQATATAQFMQSIGVPIDSVPQGYALSEALKELMRMVKHDAERKGPPLLCHGGHPVARWNADAAEVKRDDLDRIKLVKPDRAKSGKRIDGLAALGNAIKVEVAYVAEGPSIYETRGALVL